LLVQLHATTLGGGHDGRPAGNSGCDGGWAGNRRHGGRAGNRRPAQPYVSRADYVAALRTYARTQTKNGKPYVAEAHHPDDPTWIYDGFNHSEDHLHSSFTDLVINGLIGVRPQPGDKVRVAPLAQSWDWFALENVPYHGHNLTVLWDRTGSRYGQRAGLTVYGVMKITRPGLDPVTVPVGPAVNAPVDRGVNVATGGPTAFASYTFSVDDPKRINDGKVYFTDVPNTRWTSYSSPNASDWVGVDFGAAQTLSQLKVYFYDDGGGVRVPTTYQVQYWTGSAWSDVPGQSRSPAAPVANGATVVTFPPLTTTRIRLLAPNRTNNVGWGVVELEARRQ
jgi:hypothetical protein